MCYIFIYGCKGYFKNAKNSSGQLILRRNQKVLFFMINNDDIMIIFCFKNIAIFPVYRVTNCNDKSGFVSQGGSNPLVTCFSGLVKSTSFISREGCIQW